MVGTTAGKAEHSLFGKETLVLAFLTGSRMYGIPTPSSDVDLVIRVDPHVATILRDLADKVKAAKEGSRPPCRFGKLNLILCETDTEYAVWKVGTETMKRAIRDHEDTEDPDFNDDFEPLTYSRDEAKSVFDGYRKDVGILDLGDSGGPK
jgi:hypothetical protein